jgi:hypothetical protein
VKGALANLVLGPPLKTSWPWLNWPPRARWAVTLLFTALVTWLMLAPDDLFSDVQDILQYEDKLVHGALFLTLALLVRWSLPKAGGRGLSGAAVLALLVVYAGSIEVFQPLLTMADRQFEWLDLVSNYAGLCAGWLLMGLLAAP